MSTVTMTVRDIDEAYQGYLDRGRAAHARRATAETDRFPAVADCPHEERAEIAPPLPIHLAPDNRPVRAMDSAPKRKPLIERETWICLGFVAFAALAVVLVCLDAHSWLASLFV